MFRRKLYESGSREPYRISRTKVDLFLECPRCFYADQRLGVKRPSGPGFSLNSAVDELLKKEFDIHRASGEAHPLMKQYKINAIPISHAELDSWRHNFTGISFLHSKTNLELFGSIDDLWLNDKKEYCVVDYKATSTAKEISLEDEYKQGYKKQIEFYQWLLRQKGFEVSDIGYFVFCNGLKDKESFDGKLEFNLSIIEHKGDTGWVEPIVFKIYKTLNNEKTPESNAECEWCRFIAKAKAV